MTMEEAIKILEVYNRWRRGAEIPQPNATKVGMAIDRIIQYYELRTLK